MTFSLFLNCPIFRGTYTTIILSNNTEESDFEKLSSGEKQIIHTISSILYHIKNLDSVDISDSSLIAYRNVNLLLDEIELYHHPEMQRTYVFYLLNMINKLQLVNTESINILFVTHSPFILSDIPNSNILRLQDGIPTEYDTSKMTFGANIHDLLSDSFFLEQGFMGEYAKRKIRSVIKHLDNLINMRQDSNKDNWTQDSIRTFIDIVGEPLIRNSLKDMYYKAYFSEKETIEKEIQRLTTLKDGLK